MESHNGLTNGVNGTANISVVEHSTTTVEVKSIQTISSQTVQVQEEITRAGFVESVSQKSNESSSISSSIQQSGFVESVSQKSNEISSISSSIQQSAQLSEVVQQPAIQSPAVQQTVAQTPTVEQPVVQSPAVQQPVAQSPAVQQPVAQSPAVQQPVAQSPVVQQPVAQSPVAQSPVAQSPAAQSPAGQQPVAQSPAVQQPVAQSPAVQQPVAQSPVAELPAVQQPVAQSPAVQQPVAQSPAVQQPVAQSPVKVVPTPASDTNVVGKSISLPGSQPGTSDFQVPVYAINAVDRIAQAEGFTNYVINYDRGSNFGDGFVAEIVRAKIVGSQLIKGVQQDTELVLVLKLPPENKTRRETIGMNVFEREVTAYNEILPMFQKFQLDKGLKPGQGFVSFPKCYYASFDKEKDEAVIIMEDIRRKGYKMLNKYKTVDFEHAKAVLETVAQLHGLSLAMKDQCPGIFNKFKGLKDVMADGMLNDMMKSITISNCEKAIGTLEPHEENLKKKLRAFGENIFDIVQTCTNGELVEPYTVLNHGDCWTNNMMFKYQSGSPYNLCLLDWQVVRYASPVLDISYFIYQCTDSALRAQHFDNLIQGYHIALRKQVELLGSDVNQILPFTALLREMKSKAKFALSTALFIIPMLCTPNAELPNMDEMVEALTKGEVNENDGMFQMTTNTELLYKQRMSGIVRDMHRKGYL